MWLKGAAALGAGFFSYGPATNMFKGLYDKTTEMFGGASGGPGMNKNYSHNQHKIKLQILLLDLIV